MSWSRSSRRCREERTAFTRHQLAKPASEVRRPCEAEARSDIVDIRPEHTVVAVVRAEIVVGSIRVENRLKDRAISDDRLKNETIRFADRREDLVANAEVERKLLIYTPRIAEVPAEP
jgi:hypothetical protein